MDDIAELRARALANLAIADVDNAVSLLTRAQARGAGALIPSTLPSILAPLLIERYQRSANRGS